MEKKYEIIVTGGLVVRGNGVFRKDIGISGGKITTLEDDLGSLPAERKIDASGSYVFPGIIDAHTHPYYEDDFESLPMTAAWGGTTTVIHYAYAFPGMTVKAALDDALATAKKVSPLDFALHLGLFEVEKQYTQIPEAFPYGVKSFKMFMTYAKLGRMTSDYFLTASMDLVAENRGMVMVHAENGLATDYLEDKFNRLRIPAKEAFTRMRPAILEAEAINRAISIARVCGCPMYIPHISVGIGMEPVLKARAAGHTVYAETCPQYLLLTEEDFNRWGPLAKIGPPLRTREDNDLLWKALADGAIDVVASDHAPKTKKITDDFFEAGYGSPQAESLLYATYQEGINGGRISLPRLVRVLSENPARIFGLYPRKGIVAVGSDADIVVFDPRQKHILSGATGHSKAGYTLFEGMECLGKVTASFQRGRPIIENGKFVAKSGQAEYLPQGAHPKAYVDIHGT